MGGGEGEPTANPGPASQAPRRPSPDTPGAIPGQSPPWGHPPLPHPGSQGAPITGEGPADTPGPQGPVGTRAGASPKPLSHVIHPRQRHRALPWVTTQRPHPTPSPSDGAGPARGRAGQGALAAPINWEGWRGQPFSSPRHGGLRAAPSVHRPEPQRGCWPIFRNLDPREQQRPHDSSPTPSLEPSTFRKTVITPLQNITFHFLSTV